jgi:Na+/proline symporter
VGIPNIYGILIAGVIVTIYSSLGGIKSVTFTDIIQFITFCAVIPIVAYILLNSVNNTNAITDTLLNNPLFDYKKVFDFSNSSNFNYLLLFFGVRFLLLTLLFSKGYRWRRMLTK